MQPQGYRQNFNQNCSKNTDPTKRKDFITFIIACQIISVPNDLIKYFIFHLQPNTIPMLQGNISVSLFPHIELYYDQSVLSSVCQFDICLKPRPAFSACTRNLFICLRLCWVYVQNIHMWGGEALWREG